MRTTTEIWNEKSARLLELILSRMDGEYTPEQMAEIDELNKFLDTHINPKVDAVRLKGYMETDLETLLQLQTNLMTSAMKLEKLTENDESFEFDLEELESEINDFDNQILFFKEKFLMTYDKNHKFFGK
jgi:hypothetical protein